MNPATDPSPPFASDLDASAGVVVTPHEDDPEFHLPVDENGKAKTLKIFSIRRPHMRAFHFAWFSFFLAFFGWFALSPLQKNIAKREETEWLQGKLKITNIVGVLGTIMMRLSIGPFCDRFGPRLAQSLLLSIFSIPVFLVALSNNLWQWLLARFFIGFIGAAFVVTQFWTSIMFSGNIVGTANATSGGWGNLGGGVTNAVMPLIFNVINGVTNNEDNAWRFAMLIPGTALVLISIAMFTLSDDLPQGRYSDLHKAGRMEKTNPFVAMWRAAFNWRVWVLFLLYAGCFGIELVMNSNLASYFNSDGDEAFNLTQSTAGIVAGLFGLMNLFARSLGGILSDFMAAKYGMRGRLWAFFVVQFLNGCFFVVFSRIDMLGLAIPMLLMFSLFVQMSEGATFGIVPFVDPPATGAVSGIVGAGGNFGAVIGGFLVNSDKKNGLSDGFFILGFCVIASSFLIMLLWWPEYGSMWCPPRNSGKLVDDVVDTEEEETENDGSTGPDYGAVKGEKYQDA